MLALALKL
jgi:hypothetical protein